jgi:hypothetical protein
VNLSQVSSIRAKLWDGGYRPVALYTNEKRPFGNEWQHRARQNPPEAAEADPTPAAMNTGILCDGLCGVDIDVDDPILAAKIEAELVKRFGETLVRYRDNSGRRLMLYCAAEGTPRKRAVASVLGKVEVLGLGQQLHSHGTHPSGAFLRWRPEAPENVPRDTLPTVTEEQIDDFLAAVALMIGAPSPLWNKQYNTAKAPKLTVHGSPAEVAALLRQIPNDGPPDWEFFNRVGMAIYASLYGVPGGLELFIEWAKRNPAYTDAETRGRWNNYQRSPPTIVGLHTLQRLAKTATGEWPMPAISILHRSATTAPALPLEVFGPVWSHWIMQAAKGANAPPDYVVLPLLTLAAALLGNARWVVAWRGWAEPPALWCCSVGDPSSGKTSGAAPVMREVVRLVEAWMARDFPAEMKQWEEDVVVANAALKQWEKSLPEVLKAGDPAPPKPEAATMPPKPVRPRVRVMDVTIEKLAELLGALPKGLLITRDELAGWLLNLSRYSSGTDRPFWLEAYNGGPYQVDRQKNPDPVLIIRLTVSMFGTIQPDALTGLLQGKDDGLSSRYLWGWPEAQLFAQPDDAGNAEPAAGWLQRLAGLTMAKDVEGNTLPSYVELAEDARPVLAHFAREMQDRERGAHGLLKSSLGKARGQALRLALVLEYLWWAADPHAQEPQHVSLRAMQAATELMDAYFLPMAARVLGDASIPEEERNARTLAGWVMTTRPEKVNVSSIRDFARLPGLRESKTVKAAFHFLSEAGWLREAGRTGERGRPRRDWTVNPKIWDAAP